MGSKRTYSPEEAADLYQEVLRKLDADERVQRAVAKSASERRSKSKEPERLRQSS